MMADQEPIVSASSTTRSVTDKLENATSKIVILQQNALLANTYQAPQQCMNPISRNIHLRKKGFDANTVEVEEMRSILSHFQRELPNPESFAKFKQRKERTVCADPSEVILNHTQPHNSIARLSMHNDEALVEAHKKLSGTSSASTFCHVGAQKNYLHKYSWPKCLVTNLEGAEKIHMKLRQEMTQITPCSSEDVEDAASISTETKHFVVNGKANNLLWESNMGTIPSVRYEDYPFRHPTACVAKMAKQMSSEYNIFSSMSPFHSALSNFLTKRISLSNILQSKYEEALDVSHNYHKPLNEVDIDKEEVRNQIVMGLLGRHFEAVSDASIHLVLDILKPYMKISSSAIEMIEQCYNEESVIAVSEKRPLDEKAIRYRQKKNGGDEVHIEVAAADMDFLASSAGAHHETTPKRKLDSADSNGPRKRQFVDVAPKRLSTDEIAQLRSLRSNPDEPIVSWKHVLFAVQSASDHLASHSTGVKSYHVHESLPCLPLNSTVVERIKHRLAAIYSKPNIPGISKHQPEILSRSNLDKKVTHQLEKSTIL